MKARSLNTFQHGGAVSSLAFSSDGVLLASGSADTSVLLSEVISGTGLAVLTEHTREVLSVAFNPAGTLLASGDAAGALWMWDILMDERVALLEAEFGAPGVSGLAWSPDGGTLAAASTDGTLSLWRIPSS